MNLGTIKAANIHKSPRLKKLLHALADLNWHSTRDLTDRCHNYAIGTSISELRANGIPVACRRVKTEFRRWFEYRLGR